MAAGWFRKYVRHLAVGAGEVDRGRAGGVSKLALLARGRLGVGVLETSWAIAQQGLAVAALIGCGAFLALRAAQVENCYTGAALETPLVELG